jgi:hypothetical protein
VEAADNYDTGVAQLPGEIVDLKNQISRTLDGTEEGERLLLQLVQVTKCKMRSGASFPR